MAEMTHAIARFLLTELPQRRYPLQYMHIIFATLLFVPSAIGAGVMAYLVYHNRKKTAVVCYIFEKDSCQKVQSSPLNATFGIPNPYFSLVAYVALLVFAALFLLGILPLWPISLLIIAGLIFSAHFLYVQGAKIKAFCIWCVISALMFVVLAADVFLLR